MKYYVQQDVITKQVSTLGWVQIFQGAMGCVGSGDRPTGDCWVFPTMRCPVYWNDEPKRLYRVKVFSHFDTVCCAAAYSCIQLWLRDILSDPRVTRGPALRKTDHIHRPCPCKQLSQHWPIIDFNIQLICCRAFSHLCILCINHLQSCIITSGRRRIVYLYHFSFYTGYVSGV